MGATRPAPREAPLDRWGSRVRTPRLLGGMFLCLAGLVGVAAPLVAPYPANRQHREFVYAPPMPIRVVDEAGSLRSPFVYRLRSVDRVTRRFVEDRSRRLTVRWLSDGRLLGLADESHGPLLLLGADGLGRDVFSRLVLGARTSLGVAGLATLLALLFGVLVGSVAGYAGGLLDETLMRVADFIVLLPVMYVLLGLRAVLPPVLSPTTVFLTTAGLLSLIGWPYAARGVRGLIRAERAQDYVTAAISLGAGRWRVLASHLVPSTAGYLGAQAALLLPAFVLAEATLSFVGLGFGEAATSWGSMLQSVSNVQAVSAFPWLLSPAAAILLVVLAAHLTVGEGAATLSTFEHPRT